MLNEKDLYCIARHISEFVEAEKYDQQVDVAKVCYSCKYAMESTCTEIPGILDPWPTFFKLREATGVSISPRASKLRGHEKQKGK